MANLIHKFVYNKVSFESSDYFAYSFEVLTYKHA